MAAYSEIIVEADNRVATITLNRPDRLNAWTPTMEAELRAALDAAAADEAVRAIVLTGAGRGFCAGADMAGLSARANGQAAPAPSPRPVGEGDFERRYSYMLGIPKPIIAAINGAVAGVGLCVALYCDIRFIAAGAKLTTSFARRGLIAEHGSAWLLARQIGPMNAADLLFSARVLEAAEAERLGIARMKPAEGFLAEVQRYAGELANLSSPRSLRIMKHQLHASWGQRLGEAVELAEAELAQCRGTEDYREGVAHFVEKRAPRFTGR